MIMLNLIFAKPNGSEVLIRCNEENIGLIVEKCWKKHWTLCTIYGKEETVAKQPSGEKSNEIRYANS